MWMVAKVIFAVFLTAIVLLFVGFFWLKRSVLAKIADAVAAHALVPPLPPARLALEPISSASESAETQEVWEQAIGLGFATPIQLRSNENVFRLATFGPFALLLGELNGENCFVLYALTSAKKLYAVSTINQHSVTRERFDWRGADAERTLADALTELRAMIGEQTLLELSKAQAVQLIERAYAAFADDSLMHKQSWLTPEHGITEIAKLHPNAAPDKLRQAYESFRESLVSNLHDSLIDQFKRLNKFDVISWERVQASLEILHEGLRPEDLIARSNEKFGRLLQQQFDQDLPVLTAYQRANAALPEAERKEIRAEFTQPVRAQVYLNALLSDTVPSPALNRKGAQEFCYRAEQLNKLTFGSVLATSSGDATRQLRAQGFEQIEILSEPGDLIAPIKDAAAHAQAVHNAATRSPLRNLFGAVLGNAVLWGPVFVWVLWNLLQGQPFTGSDYLSFALLAAVVFFCIRLIVPMHLYERFWHFKNAGSWSEAQKLIEHRWFMRGIAEPMRVLEQAKLMASQGDLSGALALWSKQRAHVDEPANLSAVALIYYASGDSDAYISYQERLLPLSSNREVIELDIAVTLLREGKEVERAEAQLLKQSSTERSVLPNAYFHFARALLQAEKGQHKMALRQFDSACEGFPTQSAITQGAFSMFRAYQALCLKKLGQQEAANSLWSAVSHHIKPHAMFAKLVRDFEGC